jgi:hypothetical protein
VGEAEPQKRRQRRREEKTEFASQKENDDAGNASYGK